MAWHYAPDTADSTSDSTWLSEAGFEPCATSSGKQEPRRPSWRGWKNRPWSARLFGTTSEPSTVARGVAEWISSLPGTPVSPSAKPGRNSERQTPATSGLRSDGSSGRQGLLWPSSRTSEATSRTGSRTSSPTSTPTGSMRSGVCSEQPMLVPRTSASASGSSRGGATWDRGEYPTPTASRYGSSQNEGQVAHKRPTNGTPSLDTWAARWATPTARDPKGVDLPSRQGSPSLPTQVDRWPTPKAMSGGPDQTRSEKLERGRTRSGGTCLQRAATSWPTPTAGDAKAAGSRRGQQTNANPGVSLTDAVRTGDDLGRLHRETSTDGPKPRLNPQFVEWLMGLPKGWTTVSASGCSATALSLWRRRSLSELSRIVQD